MTSFVDRVTLHVAGGQRRPRLSPPCTGRSSSRSAAPTAATAATAATSSSRRPADHHPAGLPPRPAPPRHQRRPGQGDNRTAANGEDLVLPVPDGTVVKTPSGQVLADLVGDGTGFVAAAGGRGGLGNAALASPKRKAPGFALLGSRARSRDIVLELKTVADVALVGFPSAGKSSLIAAMSAARPEDRRLPVHHAGPEPRRGRGRRRPLHHRRRPRPDPGRQRGQGPRPRVPAPRRALRRAGARARLRHARARPRPAHRPGRHRGRARRPTASTPAWCRCSSARGWSR